MVRKFHFLCVFATLAMLFAFAACTNEVVDYSLEPVEPDTIVNGYALKNSLSHNFDTVYAEKAYDNMSATMVIYSVSDGKYVDSVKFQRNPKMEAFINVAKTDYTITEDQLNSQVTSSIIKRHYNVSENANDTYWEKDTVIIELNDGQVVSVPVNISSFAVQFAKNRYFCGSDTLLGVRLFSVKNLPVESATRAAYVSKRVNTEYTVELTFAEKNVQNSHLYRVYLKGYALRNVLSEDDIDKVYAENKNRVVLDATTEKCSFDEIIVMKSGEKQTSRKSIVLKRLFKGINSYNKFVGSFAYEFLKSNGLNNGAESKVRVENNWTVYGRTNKYSSDISNQIAEELIVTDYTLYHERTTYQDAFLEVVFDFEDIKVSEVSNNVSAAVSDKEGYDKSVFNNAVKASYMTYVHDISEKVNLYKIAKVIAGYEFRDAKLEVFDNKVVASLVYVVEYTDGTEELHTESKEFARSLICTTDWKAKETLTDHQTGDVSVSLQSANSQSDGYWSFVKETRILTTNVQLASSKQVNSWTSVDPNNIIYTRNGRSYKFETIEFKAAHLGDDLSVSNTENAVSTYKYTDNLEVTFGDNTINTTAPGTLEIDGKSVVGYEVRDEKLVVNDNNVVASLTFVTKYLDGTENTETVTKTIPRSLVCTTNWTANEKNANQTTAAPTFSLSKSEVVLDGNWSYMKETRTITAIASLNTSAQENSWTAVVPNSIVFSRNGLTHEFMKLKFDVAYVSAEATLANKNGLSETYTYANKINVLFGENTVSSSAPGKILVQNDKEATDFEFRNGKLTITDNEVTASLIFVTKYNDGTETTENVVKSFPRSTRCYTDWTVNTTNNNPLTSLAESELKNSDKRTDGFWSYDKETYNITTQASFSGLMDTQTNGWEAVVPNSIVYTRNGKSYEFGKIPLSANELNSKVELLSQTETQMVYSYVDNVAISFGDNTIRSSATGKILTAVTIIGYEFRSANLTVFDSNVKAELVFVTKYSNGMEKAETASHIFQRLFSTESNWKTVEANANQNTGSASVSLLSSDSKTDGFWSFVNETRSITTPVTLNASSQNNKWKSVDPNSIAYTRDGQTYKFDMLNFDVQENGANVSVIADDDEATSYGYQDKVNVSFGSNTFSGFAPGTIIVNKPWTPDFPIEWGKFVSATSTVACNENATDWVYTWSLHFEKGTLPVIVDKNASSATINPALFEYDTNAKLNGATFVKGRWINAIASDTQYYMLWCNTNGVAQNSMIYETATMWKWNSGKNSVFTNAFSFSVENDGSVLVIKKNGANFARYKAAK